MSFINNLKKRLNDDERYSLSFMRLFFFDINWLKTIWLNFSALSFKDAVKLPIIVAYNVKIKNIGKIVLKGNAHIGMFSIGVIKIGDFENNSCQTIFNNSGVISIKGNVKIHPGVKIVVKSGATLNLGNRVGFGGNSKIICYKSITIGNDFRCSWNSQIFDTDFHFLHNIIDDKYYSRIKPIVIGDNVFVGNGTTIGKGTIIPNGSVISCISKVNGDFSVSGTNLLIMGNPAKVVKIGVEMSNSWFLAKEEELASILD